MSIPIFDKGELTVTGSYRPFSRLCGFPQPEYERLRFPITPKENFKLFLARKECAWIPDLSTDVNLMVDHTTPDNNVQNFDGGIDSFGVTWDPLADRSLPAFVTPGHPVLHDIEEWETLPLPDPAAWDWAAMKKAYEPHLYPDRANYGFLPGVYLERLIHLMDSENCFCALIEEPEAVRELFQAITDIHCKNLEYQKECLDIDLVWISDDWGTQRSPFISRETLMEVIAPSYRRLMAKCKELEITPISHCCGKVAAYLPEMAEMGIQIWEPQLAVNPDLFEAFEPYRDQMMIEDYSLFTDEECDEPRAFEAHTRLLAEKYLKDGSTFITSGILGGHLPEKRKILYETLRKAAANA